MIYSVLLFMQLNWVGLLAPVLVATITFIQDRITRLQSKQDGKFQALRAKRSNKVEETINGIKIVKFNAWEKERIVKLDEMRKNEHKGVFKLFMYYGVNDMMNALTTPIIALLCFWTYSSIYRDLTNAEIYSMLALVSGLDTPLRFLVYAMLYRSKALVFCKNYAKLLAVEKQGAQKNSSEVEKGEILIEGGDFHWNNDKVQKIFKAEKKNSSKSSKINSVGNSSSPIESNRELQTEKELILKDINFKADPGEFIGVIGKVGSGKSSLLKAMTNEILKSKGTVKKNGSIALIPQEAFLMNDTVKNNILFGSQLDEDRYKKVIRLSELKDDLDILKAGDATQIGERGINLSGGQKQRVSIARALYSDSDIYLIDDALSALDAHVGHKVMENAFKEALNGKTRVMVTHQLKLLPEFDRIILIKLGKIACEGTFDDIKDLRVFKEFYNEAMKNTEEIEVPIEEREEADSEEMAENPKEESLRLKNPGSKIILNPIDPQQLKGDIKGEGLENKILHNRDSGTLNDLSQSREFIDKIEEDEQSKTKPDELTTKEKSRIQQGKINAQENKSRGVVSIETYFYYAKRLGYLRVGAVFLAFASCIAWIFALDYFVSIWMNDRLELQNKGLYPLIYLGMIIVFIIFLWVRSLIFAATFSRGGYIMLKETIYNILRRKMSFFDTTPIGQIITRTSDDGYIVDLLLPRGIFFCLTPLFLLLGICIFISVISPLQILIIVPIIFLMGRSIKRFSKISVEFQRMMMLASAPLISTLSELMKGAESLRVYDKLAYLNKIAKRRCDANTATILHEGLFYQWIVDSIEILGSILILFTLWFITLGKIYK